MRILVLTNRIPFPLNDGGNLAVNNMLEGLLEQGAQISLLSMNTSRHWVAPELFPPLFRRLERVETVSVDNDIKPWAAMQSLLNGSSYNLKRFITDDYRQALIRMLQAHPFDAILLEGLFVTPYIPTIRDHSQAIVCYRQHNVEYEIWERMARRSRQSWRKWYFKKLARALKLYEWQHRNDYDLLAAISPVDAAHYRDLGCSIPIITIPYGLPSAQIKAQDAVPTPLSLYHIGAMDWQPNMEGIEWFLKEVWPRIVQASPQTHLYLAGRNMPEEFKNRRYPNVVIAGAVPDAAAFEADKSILIVPIHSGGGIRVKILQSMAQGKAVVTTSIGLQGIDTAQPGTDVLVADTPEAFAESCLSLLSSVARTEAMGQAAHELIRTHYNQSKVSAELIQALQQRNQLPPI